VPNTFDQFIPLPGSNRKRAPGAHVLDLIPSTETVDVLIRLRRKTPLPAYQQGVHITHEEYAAKHGADSMDIDLVRQFAQHYGLNVTDELPAERIVLIEGPAGDVSKAFKVELREHRLANGNSYRGREGNISIPSELAHCVVGVFNLDNRPVCRTHSRRAPIVPAAAGFQTPGPVTDFYSPQVAAFYNFPPGLDGTGQTIGIVELGGGFTEADLDGYYAAAGVNSKPQIQVAPVKGGATNSPDPNAQDQPDGEVLLDMEVIAGIANGATLRMYFVKNGSDKQCLLGVATAVQDTAAKLSVLSLSWGGPEYDPVTMGSQGAQVQLQKQFQDNVNDDLEAAAHLGITVTVSSGDSASACVPLPNRGQPDAWDGHAHVSFPASSPWVLACGGTHVISTSPLNEESWHPSDRVGTGGGISRYFPIPSYQNGIVSIDAVNPAGGSGRGVPDVGGDAAQESGYRILFDGQWYPTPPNLPPIGGTSAVAPLWAALVALMNQSLGRNLGFLNPTLYALPKTAGAFNDVTKGTNGDYSATPGWDACTGLGTPNGAAILAAVKNAPTNAVAAPTSLSSTLFSDKMISAEARKTTQKEFLGENDAYAALHIEHNFLDDLAAEALLTPEAARGKPWTDVTWPNGTAPTVLADPSGPALTACDVVLITYTNDEGNAMAALLTPGYLAAPPKGSSSPIWTSYTHNYASFVPDLVPGSSPALESKNLGRYKLVQIGNKKVLCFKSSLHLARDGKQMPIMKLVTQICNETGASLVITTGTAGGIGAGIELGDAAITAQVAFDFVGKFKADNQGPLTSSFALKDPSFVSTVNSSLIQANSGRLDSAMVPPTRTPQVQFGAQVFGDPNICVTTDSFLYDDAENTYDLQGKGCVVEMDDAVVALAVERVGANAPAWLSIRNASDPQMPAGKTKADANEIYSKYGFYSTFSSVLACWACVLGS
jgi:kumamolisin